jgi:hypothetical protein
MDTVNESKLNAHNINKDSLSIHLNVLNKVGREFIPTSINAFIANIVVIIIAEQDIN